tara:strand:- start:12 stop:155 length:144 start_codon:yes stop_codon:yes gene_type:complete
LVGFDKLEDWASVPFVEVVLEQMVMEVELEEEALKIRHLEYLHPPRP